MGDQPAKSWPKRHPVITTLLVLFVGFPLLGAIINFASSNLKGAAASTSTSSTQSTIKTGDIIEILATKVSDDSLGIPQLSITIKNKSKRTVDAVSLKAYIYDSYDDPSGPVAGSIYTDTSVNNELDGRVQETILPNASYTAVFSMLKYPHASKAKNVSVTRLHFVDGETVESK